MIGSGISLAGSIGDYASNGDIKETGDILSSGGGFLLDIVLSGNSFAKLAGKIGAKLGLQTFGKKVLKEGIAYGVGLGYSAADPYISEGFGNLMQSIVTPQNTANSMNSGNNNSYSMQVFTSYQMLQNQNLNYHNRINSMGVYYPNSFPSEFNFRLYNYMNK